MAVDFTAIFKAQDKVSSTLKNIDNSGSALEGTFKKLAAAAAGVFSVAKIAEFGKQSVDAFANFEEGMNQVFTLLPNASDQALSDMTNQVKAFSKEMGVLPDQVVPALYQALSAGVPQGNVFDFLKVADKAAVGGVTDMETAVQGLTAVVNSYGADVMPVQKASDLMFLAAGLGATTFEELSNSLYNVLPSASSAGVAFEDISASMVALTNMGVPTSVATTQVRSVIDELSKAGTQTDKVFRKIAGKGFKDFIKGGGNLQGALQLLEKEAQKNNLGINDLFSSIEAGGAAIGLTGKGTKAFSDALEQMGSASGATDKAFEKMEQGFKRKVDKMKANLEILKISVGEKLVGAFNYLWDKAAPIVTNVSKGIQDLTGTFNNLGFSGTIEKFFGADAGAIAKMAEDYATAYIGGIQKIFSGDIKGGFTDILKAMGFDDTSITSINQFVSGVQSNLLKLAGFVQPLIGTVKNAFMSMLPTLQNILNYFTQTLLPIFQQVFGFIVTSVITPLVAYWQANIPKLANIFNNVWLILQPIFSLLAQAFVFVWNAASPMISNIIGLVLGFATSMWSILDGVIQFIAGVFTGNWQKAWDGVISIFRGIWEGVIAIFKFPLNIIIDGINAFIMGLNNIKVPDWVPEVGGKGINIPLIPKFAKGTMNAPNTFIAGEQGPELITGAAGSRVFPADDTSRIISALDRQNAPLMVSSSPFGNDGPSNDSVGGEKTVNININGNGSIKGSGLSKDEMFDYLIVHLKPILMSIIETEIFEEGDFAYEY